jgi:hypothetical protein
MNVDEQPFADELSVVTANEDDDSNIASTGSKAEESGEEKTLTAAETIRQKEISAWQAKIDSGQATVAALPEKQRWLAKFLHDKPSDVSEEKMQRMIDEKLEKARDEDAFKIITSKVNEMNLGKDDRAKLTAEYEELRRAGMGKAISLEKAVKILGLQNKKSGFINNEKREDMKLPNSGRAVSPDEGDFSPFDEEGKYDLKKGTSQERVQWLNSQRPAAGAPGGRMASRVARGQR